MNTPLGPHRPQVALQNVQNNIKVLATIAQAEKQGVHQDQQCKAVGRHHRVDAVTLSDLLPLVLY